MSDPIGDFSLKHIGNTYGTNSNGDVTVSVNSVSYTHLTLPTKRIV